jgi:hypothetical protein
MWVSVSYLRCPPEHRLKDGRPSPYEPFPRYEYLAILFELLDAERIVRI